MLVNQNTELREQNAGLQSRLEKLEEDRSAAWRSVASGGVQEGAEQPGLGVGGVEDRDWSQLGFYVPPEKLWEDDNHPHPEPAPASSTNNPKETCEYQLGFEEGYYAAREVRGAEREGFEQISPVGAGLEGSVGVEFEGGSFARKNSRTSRNLRSSRR